MDILELKELIDYHNHKYHVEDYPEITDEEFDALVKEYISLGGEFSDIALGDVSDKLNKVKHSFNILSLDKVSEKDNLRRHMERLCPGVVQPKIDGLTVVHYGEQDIFATRGNGQLGEDITNTASVVIPSSIKNNKYPVRIEVYMPISVFHEINLERIESGLKPFKNPRNAAAGMLRNDNSDKVKGLDYFAYNIVGTTMSESDQLALLVQMGYKTAPSYEYDTNNLENALEWITNGVDRSKLDFEIDGMVVKSNIDNAHDVFGETSHHPRSMVAYKFPSQGKWTKLKEIKWQIGRMGTVSPVGIIEPVDILGSTVKRVTLHNYDYIKQLNLSIGDEVFVVKANDVIPKLTLNNNKDQGDCVPCIKNCPDCGASVFKEGANLYCSNLSCISKTKRRVVHMAKMEALDIPGLSTQTVSKLMDIGFVRKPTDIFKLEVEDIEKLQGYAHKSASSLYNNIQKARTVDLDQFIYSVGAPLVGKKVSKQIRENYGNFTDFIYDIKTNQNPKIQDIEGIGPEIVKSVKDNLAAFLEMHQYVQPREHEVVSNKPIGDVINFVITGKFAIHSRSDVSDYITSKGHKVSSSVSKKTDYLVCGDKPGSSKVNKFREVYGDDATLRTISFDQLYGMIEG